MARARRISFVQVAAPPASAPGFLTASASRLMRGRWRTRCCRERGDNACATSTTKKGSIISCQKKEKKSSKLLKHVCFISALMSKPAESGSACQNLEMTVCTPKDESKDANYVNSIESSYLCTFAQKSNSSDFTSHCPSTCTNSGHQLPRLQCI
jgi:hypothetical protein